MASRQTLMSFQHFLSMLPTAPSLLIAKQAISSSPCSTSGLHSRWGIEKGKNVRMERWNAEKLGGSQSKDWDNVFREILVEVTQAFVMYDRRWETRQTNTGDGCLLTPPGHVPVVLQNRTLEQKYVQNNEVCSTEMWSRPSECWDWGIAQARVSASG